MILDSGLLFWAILYLDSEGVEKGGKDRGRICGTATFTDSSLNRTHFYKFTIISLKQNEQKKHISIIRRITKISLKFKKD